MTFAIVCFAVSGMAFAVLVVVCRDPKPVVRLVPAPAPAQAPVYAGRHRRRPVAVRVLDVWLSGWGEAARTYALLRGDTHVA